MFVPISCLAVGLGLLVFGANCLLHGSTYLAARLKLSPLVAGMLLVGVGTSLPEIMVSLIAASHGKLDVAVGTVLGSNITNILLIVGLMALWRPIAPCNSSQRQSLIWLLAVSLLLASLLFDKHLSRLDGTVLLFTLLLFGIWIWRGQIPHPAFSEGSGPNNDNTSVLWLELLWLVVGLMLLPLAAKLTVDSATLLARHLHISELVIGLSILSIGTSLPELAASFTALAKGEDEIALGNIVGSNILNILLILGLAALLGPGKVAPEAFMRDYWVMLVSSILLVLLCYRRGCSLGRGAGGAMLLLFMAYMVLLLCF